MIDYRIEWTPESNGAGSPGADVPPDPQDLTLMDAVREQLGLKLESTKAPVQSLVMVKISLLGPVCGRVTQWCTSFSLTCERWERDGSPC
jgi:hypothetical protein